MMTDPEEFFSEEQEFAPHGADLIDLEVEPADAFEQQLEVPDEGEDDYR